MVCWGLWHHSLVLRSCTRLLLLVLTGWASAASAQPPDTFIEVVNAMKRSVAPVACVSPNARRSRSLRTAGTAILVSADGRFVTPAHVLENERLKSCEAALYLPRVAWNDDPIQGLTWLRFEADSCVSNQELDLSHCRTVESPVGVERLVVDPAEFATTRPPDGTPVAFTGFPLGAIRPVTGAWLGGGVPNRR